jgi:hypothetical protein
MAISKQEKYNQDYIDCESETQQSGFYGGIIGKHDMDVFFNKCMVAKGWTPAQVIKPK